MRNWQKGRYRRASALRNAFNMAVTDAELIAEAEKQNLEVDPITAEAIQALLDKLYKTPPEIAERALSFRKPG